MKKYWACFVMGMQKALEYRFDFFMSYISSIFPIIIQVSMWVAIYQSTKVGVIYGYTYQQMILYTFFVGVIGKFLSTGFQYEMNDDIKNGGLNKYIVKPINYCFYRSSCFLGERTAVSIVFIILLLLLSGIFGFMGYFQIDIMTIGSFLISLFLSLLLQFGVYFCIGISGFWLSEISRVFPAISIILTVMSGGVFPLDILGEKINKLVIFLPFKYLLQFPVDIITGKELGRTILFSLGIQIAWVAFFWGFAQILWKKGLEKYVSVGG